MKIVVIVCRVLLGVIFLFSGVFALAHPMKPQGMPAPALAWTMVLYDSGWLKVLSAVQALGGLMVLTGFFLPVGVVLLCAETFNILCFHLFLTGGHMIAPGLVTGVLELAVIFGYRDMFRGMFQARATVSI